MSKEKIQRPELSRLTPYIPGKSIEEVGRELKLVNIIKLASNENPLGSSPRVQEAMAKESRNISLYPEQHSAILREALAQHLGVTADQLILGNGSDEIMLLVVEAFLNAGEEAIISRHTFSTYEFVTRLMSGVPILCGTPEEPSPLEEMAKRITSKTKLIWLCNPNNPTGTMISQKELEAFLAKVPPEVIVVIDEAYCEYVESGEYPNTLAFLHDQKLENVVILRTFSKIYGLAGLRVGYGIAHPKLIASLALVKLPFNINRLAQAAAIAALEDQEHAQKSFQMNQAGKTYLYREFEKLGLTYQPTQANFIYVQTPRGGDSVFMDLMKQGVIVRPLASFGIPKGIRITIGTAEQNQAFVKALEKISP